MDLAVDFAKFSNAREAFFIRCFTVTDVSQSTEYLLIISAKPELKLGQHFIDGRIVNVNTVVSLRHRRNSILVKSVCETPLGLHLCTRIWVRAMIGLLKKPLSICQSRWKEIWNPLPVIRWVRWGAKTRISALLRGVSCVCLCACSPTRAWRQCDGDCLSALDSRNSNWELVSHLFISRPIADAICHTLFKLSSPYCLVWI